MSANEQPGRPGEPPKRPPDDLAADPPGDILGHAAGGRAGEYRHQQYEQTGVLDPSQDRPDDCSGCPRPGPQ